MIGRIKNDLESLWKGTLLVCFKIDLLSRDMHGENDESCEDSRLPGQYFNSGPQELLYHSTSIVFVIIIIEQNNVA
jgi:hypothetical protein